MTSLRDNVACRCRALDRDQRKFYVGGVVRVRYNMHMRDHAWYYLCVMLVS